MRARESPRSAPVLIGLKVFVSMTIRSRTAASLVASHSPIHVSLRPPPYASAVSNVVMPRSHAASMIRMASSLAIPWPKNAGADPTPPKFPQPRITRDTSMPLRPSSRCSTATILGGLGDSNAALGRDAHEHHCADECRDGSGDEDRVVPGGCSHAS